MPQRSVLAATVKRNASLTFVDEATGQILAAPEVGSPTAQPHEVILTADGRRALVTLYGDGPYPWNAPSNQIAVVDLNTFSVERHLDLDLYRGPHGLALDHLKRIWVTVEENQCVLVLDPDSLDIVRTVHVESRCHFIIATPDGRTIYSAHKELPYLGVIDTEAGAMVGKIPLDIGSQALAISPDGGRLFVADFFRPLVHVIDPVDGSVTGSVPLAAIPGWPYATSDGRYLFVSSYDEQNDRGYVEAFDAHSLDLIVRAEVPAEPFHVFDGGDGGQTMLAVIGDGRIIRVSLTTGEIDDLEYKLGAGMPEQVVRLPAS